MLLIAIIHHHGTFCLNVRIVPFLNSDRKSWPQVILSIKVLDTIWINILLNYTPSYLICNTSLDTLGPILYYF